MNQAVKEYQKETARFFPSDSKLRKKLLRNLDNCLASLLADISDPDLQALTAAFGSPEDLANALMEEIPASVLEQYKRRARTRRRIGVGLAAVVAVALLALTVYSIFIKETNGLTVDVGSIIVDEAHETMPYEEVDLMEENQ